MLNNNTKYDLLNNPYLQLFCNDYLKNSLNGALINSRFHDLKTFMQTYRSAARPVFLSINIQSLNSKYEKLTELVVTIQNNGLQIDIIALQETWKIKSPHLLRIPGFQPLIVANCTSGKGGGVGFYVREGISFNQINENITYKQVINDVCVQ